VGHYCNAGFEDLMKGMAAGEWDTLDVMHHLLAGYKAIFSGRILDCVEVARKSCGGAGYSAWSGFPNLFFNTSPIPTYEGDNTVMLLQASRYLKKLVNKAKKGKAVPEPFTYINDYTKLVQLKGRLNTVDDLLNLDLLEEAMQVRACLYIRDVFTKIASSTAPELTRDNEDMA